MFRAFAFTEMQYPYVPYEYVDTVRNNLPNGVFDPDAGHELFHKYIEMYLAADAMGLDIMVNEHHSTSSCLNSTMPLVWSILAHQTKNARLLALGHPIANNRNPVRVAEEIAMVDVISAGRTEVGFVRGVPFEIGATNTSPVRHRERFWEAADLIVKAWTTHDGPFSWEGKYFHHRQVNIWPRPYQQPMPPLWYPTNSASSAPLAAERGMAIGTVLTGREVSRTIFEAYRHRLSELGRPLDPTKLGYMCQLYVGETDEEAFEEAKKLRLWHARQQTPAQFGDYPGYMPAAVRGAAMEQAVRSHASGIATAGLGFGHGSLSGSAPIEELVANGYFLVGAPDTVVDQIRRLYDYMGAFGNLIVMVNTATMSNTKVIRSMERFACEVLPRVRGDIFDPDSAMAASV